jgi:dynein heavy chain
LDYATRLVGALSANGVIWEQTIENSAAALEVLPGECLVACSFSSYVGVFTRNYRMSCVKAYVEFLQKNDVKLGDNPDPLEILSSDAERAKWAGQGLPSDQVSMENGAIMTNSQRWPLIIDPQLQGIVWIRNKEADNNLQVTRMGQKNMVPTFEQAIDHGRSVLIENMGEKIDAVLAPVISRTTIKRGSRKVVKLGDKEIYLSPTFKMFMQTKLSNPHYPPEIQAECTIINFTVTEDGLEDQLLFLVVRLERPDLAKKKSELITQQNEFKVTLAELEKFLLEKLADAGDDILEDTVLICSLEDAKNTSDTVKEKTIVAQQTEAQINETSEYYRPVGNRGSLLFFLLMDLSKMHTFYRYSLDSFVMVVTRSVDSVTLRKPKPPPEPPKEEGEKQEEGEKGEGEEDEDEEEEAQEEVEEDEEIIELHGNELKQRVTLLEKVVTYAVFDYTRRGLLDADKLTVATMMTLKMLQRRGKITKEEVHILVNAPADLNPGVMPDNARSFLTDVQWAQLKTLEQLPAFKTSGALTQQVESEKDLWKRWAADEKPESVDLPRGVRELSLFHRLFLLRILRPDRMGAALSQFIVENCGQEYIEQEPFDMFKCYEESTCHTPFFFVLFPGTDPTPVVEAVAASVGCTAKNEKLMNISMGQGQEKKALLSMDKLATTGGWVMLQNIHLMQDWLPQLERALETIEEISVPEFRCVLTSEPPGPMQGRLWPLLPEAILQRCIKVSDESPTDLKSNLRRAYSKFSQANIDACLKPREFKATLFALCFFHALISGRIKFGPQGWSKKYPFNDGDLTICGEVLCNYLNNSETLGTEVPWADLRYLFGEIMYGGHITDFWDRKVDNTYLAVLVTPALLEFVNLCPAYNQGFKSPDASKMEYAQYVKYIEDKFPPEQPQMYGLHPNAEIGFLTAQGAAIWNTIREIAGGSGGSGSGDGLAAAQSFITGYMEQLPKNLDMLEIRSGLKEEDMTPYVMVSLQESERMNILLNKMRYSMIELELGISGALNITENMEELSVNLQVGRVNAGWAALAYPSLKGLAAWFADLLLRVSQLMEWTTELKLLRSLWLSGLFNPMSFMTAVMQTTARTEGLPLDFMTNRCRFTNTRDVAELSGQPADGVYIHGLYMEGSGWEEGKGEDEGYITDSKHKELHPYMPICNVFSVQIEKMDWTAMYHCPVFATSTRGATFIFQANVKMDPDDDEKRWVLAGAALLTQDD